MAWGEFPDGTVCLASVVREFGGLKNSEYIGHQKWKGRAWSKMVEGLPEEAVVSIGNDAGSRNVGVQLRVRYQIDLLAIHDYWGNRVAWQPSPSGHKCLLRRREVPADLDTVPILSQPILKRDRSGRVVICSWSEGQAEVRLWNGNEWARPLTFPMGGVVGIAQVLLNPDGNIYVVGQGKAEFVIQRIKLVLAE